MDIRTTCAGRAFKLVLASAILAVCVNAQAQTPPPGALADLGANATFATATPATTTPYTFNFIATQSTTAVSFAFREVPAYFALSSPSVTAQGSTANLLVDPLFTGSTAGQYTPTNWGRWIQPIDVSAIGLIATPSAPQSCSDIVPTGNINFWCDGSVQGFDAIYQNLATTVGNTYTISFNLADNSGDNWTQATTTGQGIDMLVYASNGIPSGTTSDCPTCAPAPPPPSVPEPASWALLGLGLAGIGLGMRHRRRLS